MIENFCGIVYQLLMYYLLHVNYVVCLDFDHTGQIVQVKG